MINGTSKEDIQADWDMTWSDKPFDKTYYPDNLADRNDLQKRVFNKYPHLISLDSDINFAIKDSSFFSNVKERIQDILRKWDKKLIEAMELVVADRLVSFKDITLHMQTIFNRLNLSHIWEKTWVFNNDFIDNLHLIIELLTYTLETSHRYKEFSLKDQLEEHKTTERFNKYRAVAQELTYELKEEWYPWDWRRWLIGIEKLNETYYTVESYGEQTVIDTTNKSILWLWIDMEDEKELIRVANLINFIKYYYWKSNSKIFQWFRYNDDHLVALFGNKVIDENQYWNFIEYDLFKLKLSRVITIVSYLDEKFPSLKNRIPVKYLDWEAMPKDEDDVIDKFVHYINSIIWKN